VASRLARWLILRAPVGCHQDVDDFEEHRGRGHQRAIEHGLDEQARQAQARGKLLGAAEDLAGSQDGSAIDGIVVDAAPAGLFHGAGVPDAARGREALAHHLLGHTGLEVRAKAGERIVQPGALHVLGLVSDSRMKLFGERDRPPDQPEGARVLHFYTDRLQLLAQLVDGVRRARPELRPIGELCEYP
jgi:hypothetical protein